MRRTRRIWVRLAPLAGLMLAGGCFARIENGLDAVLGFGAQGNAQVVPYAAIGAFALFLNQIRSL